MVALNFCIKIILWNVLFSCAYEGAGKKQRHWSQVKNLYVFNAETTLKICFGMLQMLYTQTFSQQHVGFLYGGPYANWSPQLTPANLTCVLFYRSCIVCGNSSACGSGGQGCFWISSHNLSAYSYSRPHTLQ